MTPGDMEHLASVGRFWWMRADKTYYATTIQNPESAEDTYLLDASPNWVAQWESWEQAHEELTPVLSRLDDA